MRKHWVRRRAHRRHLKSGHITWVHENWALYEFKQETEGTTGRYRHPCPKCGATIISVRMPNGGWVHFEGEKGLERVKHACFNRGVGLLSSRDELTPDLFVQDEQKTDPEEP